MFLDGELVLAPIRLGAHSTVWSRALVEPGASLGEGAALHAHSVLVMGHAVPGGECWLGIPAGPHADAPAASPVHVRRAEVWTYTLVGAIGFPLAVAALLGGWLTLLGLISPDASWGTFNVWLWLLAYPTWLAVSLSLGVVGTAAKWALLGRLRPGDSEEDHPIALPLVRLMTMAMRRLSLLWPNSARWAVLRSLGARVSARDVTVETFLDWAYADLYRRDAGSFFSPAGFIDFASARDGRRVLDPIDLVTGAYVGAYCTLTAPLETRPMSVIAGCSALPPGTTLADEEAWVGAPARRVPIRVGEVSLDAFELPSGTLRRLRLFEDIQRYLLFTMLTGITWAGLLLLGRPPGLATGVDAALLTLGHLVFTLGATWAVFIPLLRWEGGVLRRAVDRDEVLARDGLVRGSGLFRLWGTTVFHLIPVAR